MLAFSTLFDAFFLVFQIATSQSCVVLLCNQISGDTLTAKIFIVGLRLSDSSRKAQSQ